MSTGISVVLLSKDEPQLERSLELLRPQCEALGAECVVIDASEHRLDAIRDRHSWVNWHSYQGPFWRRSTIPHQRNVGVRVARGGIIAFCDAGGEPGPDWLAALVAPILSSEAQYVCGPIRSIAISNYTAINDVADGVVVDAPPTANVAFTRDTFNLVQGFDQRYYYGSDVDFAYRLSLRGVQCKNVAAAVMGMNWGPVSTSLKRAWRYGRAWPRAFRFQPGRRAQLIRHSPERLVYSGWIVGLLPALLMGLIVHWAVLAAYGLIPIALLMKNVRAESPWRVVLVHFIEGAAGIFELVSGWIGEVPPIWHWSASAVSNDFAVESSQFGNDVTLFSGSRPWSRPVSTSLLLGRIRGVRAIHLDGDVEEFPTRWKSVARWADRLGIVVASTDRVGRTKILTRRDWVDVQVTVDESDANAVREKVQVVNELLRMAASSQK